MNAVDIIEELHVETAGGTAVLSGRMVDALDSIARVFPDGRAEWWCNDPGGEWREGNLGDKTNHTPGGPQRTDETAALIEG